MIYSVYNFTPIHCTSQLGPAIGLLGCGTFSEALAYEFSSDTKEQFLPWRSVLTDGILQALVCILHSSYKPRTHLTIRRGLDHQLVGYCIREAYQRNDWSQWIYL